MQPVCFQTCTPLAQRAASPLEVPHPCNQPATPATLLGCRATFDTSMDDAWDDATFDPLTFDFGLGGLDGEGDTCTLAMAAKEKRADAAAPAAGPRLTVTSKELALHVTYGTE